MDDREYKEQERIRKKKHQKKKVKLLASFKTNFLHVIKVTDFLCLHKSTLKVAGSLLGTRDGNCVTGRGLLCFYQVAIGIVS